jgi:general secretion pathway protein E
MGVEPFLITSTLNAVLAQRLVRRLCQHCREEYTPSEAALRAWSTDLAGHSIATLCHPKGCDACEGTGFRGRLAVTELLIMNDEIARLVLARAEAREIQRAAMGKSMRTMFADGLAKAQAGLTTIEEVLRATREV